MLVDSVARVSANSATVTVKPPPIAPSRSVGFQIVSPKITAVALVTATPMNANRVIVVGRPIAWPRTWSRWLCA